MEYVDDYATNSEQQVPKTEKPTHLLKLFIFWMEKAGSVVRAGLALSALRSVEILSRVIQLLGGEVVSPRHDEVVLKIEGFVLALDELTQNLAKGDTDLLYGPVYLVCKHPVHRRDNLYWHVDEPL